MRLVYADPTPGRRWDERRLGNGRGPTRCVVPEWRSTQGSGPANLCMRSFSAHRGWKSWSRYTGGSTPSASTSSCGGARCGHAASRSRGARRRAVRTILRSIVRRAVRVAGLRREFVRKPGIPDHCGHSRSVAPVRLAPLRQFRFHPGMRVKPAEPLSLRLDREQRTIEAMLRICCPDQHRTTSGLCRECEDLLTYAGNRLRVCPFQEAKPACNRCPIHCYAPAVRERARGHALRGAAHAEPPPLARPDALLRHAALDHPVAAPGAPPVQGFRRPAV